MEKTSKKPSKEFLALVDRVASGKGKTTKTRRPVQKREKAGSPINTQP